MSAAVKLGSAMPGDFEVNGLDALAEELVEDPSRLRAAFVLFDVQKVTENTDTDERVPTVRVRRFEPLGHADDVSSALRAAYEEAVEKRTGRKALPLQFAEVVHDDQGTIDDAGDEF